MAKRSKIVKVRWIARPQWEDAPGGSPQEIMLSQDACFRVYRADGTYEDYWIPRNYICDGASIPLLVWIIPGIGTPTQGDNARGAWAHDPLFLTHALPFMEANRIALLLWQDAGKGAVARRLMWVAVCSPAGMLAWRNSEKDAKALAKIRAAIRRRPDKAKFASLWFVTR